MKPHKDLIRNGKKSGGYSIRMGQTVPENSANLAYMYSKPLNPKENLFVEDRSKLIQENGLQQYIDTELMVFPDEAYLLESESGQSLFPSDKVNLTDEFTVKLHSGDSIYPLYYKFECKLRFNAVGSYVLPYVGGRTTQLVGDAIRYEDLTDDEQANMLYMGDVIHVKDATTGLLPDGLKYKIQLIRDGSGDLFRVIVYTNFRSDETHSYIVEYPAYISGKARNRTEVMNAYPFFNKVTYTELKAVIDNPTPETLSIKQYAIVKKGKGFNLYATSQVMVANMETRPPQTFRYRTEAKLSTRMSDTNKGSMNVGLVELNTSVSGVEGLKSVGKLLSVSSYKPSYLTLDNPHPPIGYAKSSVNYWIADLKMPAHHYLDYDVLILTGYGYSDLSPYREYLEDYMNAGGILWVDNAGRLVKDSAGNIIRDETMTFTNSDGDNTFLVNLEFSNTKIETGSKKAVTTGGWQTRYYTLPDSITDLGYENVGAQMSFSYPDKMEDYKVWVQYGSTNPAVISKAYGKGTLIASNCGIFRSIYHSDDLTAKFVFNTLLTYAENKWFNTPWKYDYVYHRDNLFDQEYKDVAGNQIYKDDRNDLDVTQIVAKKALGKTCREALLPYIPSWFQTAKGTYTPVVEDDNELTISNNDFESVRVNSAGTTVTAWTATTADAIPGWDAKIMAGTATTFNHTTAYAERGIRSVAITVNDKITGAQSYWESEEIFLAADMYELTAWVRTKGVLPLNTTGAKVGIYDEDGNLVAASVGADGTRNWTQLKIKFTLKDSLNGKIRIGFIDGNGSGVAWFDMVQLINKGNVSITPSNDGSKSLYAYAVMPKGSVLDIDAQGYSEEDITRIQPPVDFRLIIRSFVYKFNNLTARYERTLGSSSNYYYSVSKADSNKPFGYLHSLLPALKSGAEWSDKNRVYYEILAIGEDGYVNPLVNVSLYDTSSGKEYFLKNGELIIGYKDLYWAKTTPTILLQAQTPYETVRVSNRHFGLELTNDNRIYLESPRTTDTRESWFIRVKNGSFIKKELGYEEWKGLSGNPSQTNAYSSRTIQEYTYSIPEYYNQVYSPFDGIKTVEDQVEFLTPRTVRLPHGNLWVESGSVSKEAATAIGDNRTIFEASHERWDERKNVSVYADKDGTGTLIEVFEDFDVDYKKGLVTFETPVLGDVQLSYSYNNLRVFKRTYGNGKVTNELLRTEDRKNYYSAKPFLMSRPVPVLKKRFRNSKTGLIEDQKISSKLYTVDYERGLFKFTDEQKDGIYIDYGYYTQTELTVSDYDIINGIVYLSADIDFQDDIYAEYSYEEHFYDYRGYYDDNTKQFMYLDLNPSVGHYSTLPQTQVLTNGTQTVVYKYSPSAQLLNKEIHLYIVPTSMGGASVRHCFSASEWRKIQESNPLCLLLGKLYVRENTDVSQVVTMDARTRGGGLSEKITDADIVKRVQHKQRYWDIGSWNGKAYYRNGTLILRIPKTVLQSHGGNFTEEQVQEMLDKYVAYGTYMIIEYV